MCDQCNDDGYVMVGGETIPCPQGCEPKSVMTTDMADASYDDEDYAYG